MTWSNLYVLVSLADGKFDSQYVESLKYLAEHEVEEALRKKRRNEERAKEDLEDEAIDKADGTLGQG